MKTIKFTLILGLIALFSYSSSTITSDKSSSSGYKLTSAHTHCTEKGCITCELSRNDELESDAAEGLTSLSSSSSSMRPGSHVSVVSEKRPNPSDTFMIRTSTEEKPESDEHKKPRLTPLLEGSMHTLIEQTDALYSNPVASSDPRQQLALLQKHLQWHQTQQQKQQEQLRLVEQVNWVEQVRWVEQMRFQQYNQTLLAQQKMAHEALLQSYQSFLASTRPRPLGPIGYNTAPQPVPNLPDIQHAQQALQPTVIDLAQASGSRELKAPRVRCEERIFRCDYCFTGSRGRLLESASNARRHQRLSHGVTEESGYKISKLEDGKYIVHSSPRHKP